MKQAIYIIFFVISLYSCHNNAGQSAKEEKFNKINWATREGNDYPHREKMLKDLVANGKLKGLAFQQLADIIGQPDRSDNGYLFYRIAQTRLGFFPLHTTTLVIKLSSDSIVQKLLIHE